MTNQNIHHPRLTSHVRVGEQSIKHSREFGFPAGAVQHAHSDPELFVQWMGPTGTSVLLDRFDAQTGGAFRYVVEAPNGGSWAFRGSYHSVSPGAIIHTWEYEGETGTTLEMLEFRDIGDGHSLLEVTSTYTSMDACDAMIASGIDAGMDENFDRLDGVLSATTHTS